MKKIFAIALGVLALAACNREAAPQLAQQGDVVKFTTRMNNYVVKAGETALEGKTVQIIAGTPIEAVSAATVAGETLTLTNPIHWNKDQTEATTFAAVYQREGDAPTTLSVPYAIDNDDLDYHGSYLTAVAKNVTPGNEVTLNFKHPFAKVTVNVTNNLESTPAISALTFDGLVIAGTIDLAADAVELTGDATTVAPVAQNDGSYQAILLPQTAKPVLRITAGEKNFAFALPAAVAFEANKAYTVAVTLTESTPVIEDGDEVTFGFTVADWADAEAPLAYEDVTDAWYVSGCVYTGATAPAAAWGEDIPMVKGTDGKYSVTVTYDEALAGEDASAKGFLIHKIGYTAKYGTWANSPRVNLSWGSYGLTATDGVNILLCTVTGEAPDEVWTPYNGTVTITFNPADGQMTWTTE